MQFHRMLHYKCITRGNTRIIWSIYQLCTCGDEIVNTFGKPCVLMRSFAQFEYKFFVYQYSGRRAYHLAFLNYNDECELLQFNIDPQNERYSVAKYEFTSKKLCYRAPELLEVL